MSQNMFLVNPSSTNKTLFYRITDAIELEAIDRTQSTSKSSSPTRASPKKRGKAKQAKAPATVTVQDAQVTFIDSSVSEEQEKKGSYENFGEANSLADYLGAFRKELGDLSKIAIMSPFRT